MSHIKLEEFTELFDTLSMASIDDKNQPHISYAPFVESNQSYYICISKKAKHTNNLLNNPKASIMFIEDEIETKSSFARKRITLDVDVTNIPRESERFTTIMEFFTDKFGEKSSIYKQLADFYLFELTPYDGRGVFGMGKAFDYEDLK